MKSILLPRRHVLAIAMAMATAAGLGGVTGAFAQSTTGSLFGQVTVTGGETVLIENSNGLKREVGVDERGRYVAPQLPLGTYKVSLMRNGTVVDSRDNVSLRVGSGTDVSFAAAPTSAGAANAENLAGVTVTGNALPAIDVTSVDSRTVITSEQLAKLPLGRSAEDIAKLAPGVTANTGNFKSATGTSLVSFGGSAASENAYYINGFNTTDPLNGLGGITLPYGAIDQQEVYTGAIAA